MSGEQTEQDKINGVWQHMSRQVQGIVDEKSRNDFAVFLSEIGLNRYPMIITEIFRADYDDKERKMIMRDMSAWYQEMYKAWKNAGKKRGKGSATKKSYWDMDNGNN